ncbi:AMP-binding protein [Streptomyces spinosirectus]|jgi:hypothetical protein|uniref:AMP-binding protein n=1 Tax=Streptomyces spinosirectus TaxID=2906474 RepID=UPI000FFE7AB5
MPDVSALNLDVIPEPTASLGVLPAVAAEKHPDTPFLSDTPWRTYDHPVRDFADFARAVDDYADRFWAAGIRRGDVVAVVQRNHIEVEGVMCGLGKIGALPALLSSGMETGELLECFARLENPYLVVDSLGLSRLAESRHALRLLTRNVLCLEKTDETWVVPLQERLAHTVCGAGVPRRRRRPVGREAVCRSVAPNGRQSRAGAPRGGRCGRRGRAGCRGRGPVG